MVAGINYMRYSGDLTQGVWVKNNCAIADIYGQVSMPNAVAQRVIATGTGGGDPRQYFVEGGIPEYQPNTEYTVNIWIRPETSQAEIAMSLVASGPQGAVSINSVFYPFALGGSSPVAPSGSAQGGWSNENTGVIPLPDNWFHVWLQGTTPPTLGQVLGLGVATVAARPPGESFIFGGVSLFQGNEFDYAATTTAPRGNLFLPTFDFPYHKVETTYVQGSTTVQFGEGYIFSSKPRSPPYRVFNLEFGGLQWQTDVQGVVDQYFNANNNVAALEAFYLTVELYGWFTYNHPMYGPLVCKFNKPLKIPAVMPGGGGVVPAMQIELVEIPQ